MSKFPFLCNDVFLKYKYGNGDPGQVLPFSFRITAWVLSLGWRLRSCDFLFRVTPGMNILNNRHLLKYSSFRGIKQKQTGHNFRGIFLFLSDRKDVVDDSLSLATSQRNVAVENYFLGICLQILLRSELDYFLQCRIFVHMWGEIFIISNCKIKMCTQSVLLSVGDILYYKRIHPFPYIFLIILTEKELWPKPMKHAFRNVPFIYL